MLVDIGSDLLHRQVIVVVAEGVFDLLSYQLQAAQHIKDKAYNGSNEIAQGKHVAERQGDHVEEDEFLNKSAVRMGDGCVLDTFAGAADICKGRQFPVQDDQLVAGDLPRFVQAIDLLRDQAGHLVGYMLSRIDIAQLRVCLLVQRQAGTFRLQVRFEHFGVQGYRIAEKSAAFRILFGQHGVQFQAEVAAVVHECPPELAAFPPAVVGRVGAEYEQDRDRKAQQAVQGRDVLYPAVIAQVQVFQFPEGNEQGVHYDEQDQRRQFAGSICLRDQEQGLDPGFVVVNLHGRLVFSANLSIRPIASYSENGTS